MCYLISYGTRLAGMLTKKQIAKQRHIFKNTRFRRDSVNNFKSCMKDN
jgi:hypothetical protein